VDAQDRSVVSSSVRRAFQCWMKTASVQIIAEPVAWERKTEIGFAIGLVMKDYPCIVVSPGSESLIREPH
jgi:hypothetical protein